MVGYMIWVFALLQTILFVAAAPLLSGLVKWLKCRLQNRRGSSILQPYRSLKKLFKKETIVANNASFIFHFTPYLIFTITILISATIPLIIVNSPFTYIADIIVLIGLFALARFFLALSGLDIGTAFGGMGSSREMMLSSLAEPALLLAFFTLAMNAESTNLSTIIQHFITTKHLLFSPSLIFTALGFVIIAVAETGRIPIDNPDTHLELTMIHEAMILEYSGHHLALIEWASQIKFMIYCVLFVDLFFPFGLATSLTLNVIGISCLALLAKLFFLSFTLSIAEINLAKIRLFRAPYLLSFAFLLCLLGVLNHIILEVR